MLLLDRRGRESSSKSTLLLVLSFLCSTREFVVYIWKISKRSKILQVIVLGLACLASHLEWVYDRKMLFEVELEFSVQKKMLQLFNEFCLLLINVDIITILDPSKGKKAEHEISLVDDKSRKLFSCVHFNIISSSRSGVNLERKNVHLSSFYRISFFTFFFLFKE